ncbi:MAG: hypothetical protein V3W41_01105 [Planctomycetota bacterium]
MARQPTPTTYAGVFLLAASIILFEIALTRVFAIMMWHHLTYMVVSIAMLGFGAAGSVLTLRRRRLLEQDSQRPLAFYSALYAVAVLLAFAMSTVIRLDSLKLWTDKGNLAALLLLYGVVATPLFFGGLAIGLALMRWPEKVHRMYFADLIGSALGAALSVALLAEFGSATTIVYAATLGAFAAVFFAITASARVLMGLVPLLLAFLFITIGFSGGSERIGIPEISWRVPFAPGKEFTNDMPLDRHLPSATAEISVRTAGRQAPVIGGDFGLVEKRLVNGRLVAQDGTAPTMLYENAADIDSFSFLDDSQTGCSYLSFLASGRREPKVLVIGNGGGIDVMVGLAFKAKEITAIEVNKAMVRMVKDEYNDYLGGLFDEKDGPHAGRVKLIHAEGRSFLEHSDESYDIIQLNGVDSFTALTTGAYTLSESYLYTTDAVRALYARLADNGFVSYSRFILSGSQKPRETLRLANIARQALVELEVSDPSSQIVVFQGIDWASTLIKKGPFTAAEIKSLETLAWYEGFKGIIYDPTTADKMAELAVPAPSPMPVTHYFRSWLARLTSLMTRRIDSQAAADDLAAAFVANFKGDTDRGEELLRKTSQRFPRLLRNKAYATLKDELAQVVERGRQEAKSFAETRKAFAAVLGRDDKRRREFIRDYEYDISACTDDSPFFFNYYRWNSLLDKAGDFGGPANTRQRYHPDFPVGHMVLLASFLQIAIFAIILIIMPLRALGRQDSPRVRGAWRYLVYFGALGLGFMTIEIVLMQKLLVMLGHPTYAMAIVLPAILGFAGLGSWWSQRFGAPTRPRLWALLAAIWVGVLIAMVTIEFLGPLLLGSHMAFRIALTMLAIGPLGLALGTAFPWGLDIVNANEPRLVPWAWAVNGFASVLASIAAIALSQEIGFNRTLLAAAVAYAIGLIVVPPARTKATAPSSLAG